MKKYIGIIGLFILSGLTATAQQKSTSTPPKRTSSKALIVQESRIPGTTPPVQSMTSTGTHPAKAPAGTPTGLTIADPTIKAMHQIGDGIDPGVNPTRVVGQPKTAYGIANGRIKFNPSGAPSLGTLTGSGSVGTGSSPGSAGASHYQMGLNGKSPYAGSGMWGTATGNGLRLRDSVGSSSGFKKAF